MLLAKTTVKPDRDFYLYTNEADFLANRQSFIGSSDAAAILGLSEYCGPFSTYCRKRGLIEQDGDNEAMYMGRLMEPVILDEFERMTGLKVERGLFVRHPDLDYIGASLDGAIFGPEGEIIAPVEAKNIGARSVHLFGTGEDEIPDMYALQLHHQMFAMGAEYGYLIAFLGGNQRRVYKLKYRSDLIKPMLKVYADFWNLVKTGTPPEVDALPGTEEVLRLLSPVDTQPEPLTADENALRWALRLSEGQRTVDRGEKIVQDAKNHLIQIMGEYGKLQGEGWSISYKKGTDSEVVDYKSLLTEITVAKELLDKHTKTRVGVRSFRPNIKKLSGDEE